MKKLAILLLPSIFIFILISCGGSVNKEKAKTDTEKAVEKSASNIKSNELPEGFPEDIYIYNPSKITHSMSMEDGAYSVTLETKDNASEIIKKYENEMKTKGWKGGELEGMSNVLNFSKENVGIQIRISKLKEDIKRIGITVTRD
jgi:hypothetical protein